MSSLINQVGNGGGAGDRGLREEGYLRFKRQDKDPILLSRILGIMITLRNIGRRKLDKDTSL